MDPILSICIPTYNRGALLSRMLATLDAALTNAGDCTYEIVVRDNASTDHTWDVVRRFSQRHPVKYFRNDENIGLMRNVLSCPSNASGRFIWMLGDDDLILPDGVRRICERLREHPEALGLIACHAIAQEDKRIEYDELVAAGRTPPLGRTLIRAGVRIQELERFEDFYKYTDVAGALNFLSNVVVRTECWAEHVEHYLQHCETTEWFSDPITTVGHMYVWADCLVGKAVGVIATPVVIGFVGQQEILDKWATLLFGFVLDVSKHFEKLDADRASVRCFQRTIYKSGGTIARLAASEDPYTRKHFSVLRLVQKYGDDPLVWKSLLQAVAQARGLRKKIRVLGGMLRLPTTHDQSQT
jgi:glycosyltransferase involved in cell wall biosynthesis